VSAREFAVGAGGDVVVAIFARLYRSENIRYSTIYEANGKSLSWDEKPTTKFYPTPERVSAPCNGSILGDK